MIAKEVLYNFHKRICEFALWIWPDGGGGATDTLFSFFTQLKYATTKMITSKPPPPPPAAPAITATLAPPDDDPPAALAEGAAVGDTERLAMGFDVGDVVGDVVGVVGEGVGALVGVVGDKVGDLVGDEVGDFVGDEVGDTVPRGATTAVTVSPVFCDNFSPKPVCRAVVEAANRAPAFDPDPVLWTAPLNATVVPAASAPKPRSDSRASDAAVTDVIFTDTMLGDACITDFLKALVTSGVWNCSTVSERVVDAVKGICTGGVGTEVGGGDGGDDGKAYDPENWKDPVPENM